MEQRVAPFQTHRPFVLAGVILAMFMSAVEATIVSTAVPSIVGDIGGFSHFSWVFSSFLLTQAVTIPIYGKLADLYGRKPIFIIGVLLFLLGSLLCGFAKTMAWLIFFRFVQGIGAGAVQPIATTIIGDLYTIQERAKIQGYLSSVWGISSIIGPALGGFFVQYLYWGWVFWLNLPLGLVSIFCMVFFLHERVHKKQHGMDYLGSGLLFVSISACILVLIEGGSTWPWTSPPVLLLTALFLLTFLLFLFQEKRAKEPTVPLAIWRNRIITVANLASLTTGIVMVGVASFLPTLVQGVFGKTPIVAGFTLAMMSIGWPLAATLAGKAMIRLSFFVISLSGGIVLILGALVFVLLSGAGIFWLGCGAFLIGVGMGLTTTTFIVSIQSSVDWQTRGVATASNMFMRILGNTVGVALLGGILNAQMSRYLGQLPGYGPASNKLEGINQLLNAGERVSLPLPVMRSLQEALQHALNHVFWAVLFFAVVSFLIILKLPRKAHGKD